MTHIEGDGTKLAQRVLETANGCAVFSPQHLIGTPSETETQGVQTAR
jgi:hypothetical protein